MAKALRDNHSFAIPESSSQYSRILQSLRLRDHLAKRLVQPRRTERGDPACPQ
jgi:hypothetical protein